jgi:hypothetical protein
MEQKVFQGSETDDYIALSGNSLQCSCSMVVYYSISAKGVCMSVGLIPIYIVFKFCSCPLLYPSVACRRVMDKKSGCTAPRPTKYILPYVNSASTNEWSRNIYSTFVHYLKHNKLHCMAAKHGCKVTGSIEAIEPPRSNAELFAIKDVMLGMIVKLGIISQS